MAEQVVPVNKKKELHCPSVVTYHPEPPELTGGKTQEVQVNPGDFFWAPKGVKTLSDGAPYLIIGFDTEFKTPEYLVSKAEIKDGAAKNRILSYQFHAKASNGPEWQGICCPDDGKRMSLGEFVVMALGMGAREHNFSNLPTRIYLVGHFTRADVPAFSDFNELTDYLSSVRNTFISTDISTPLKIQYPDGVEPTILNVFFRDTLLLTPQASKSLKALGELVGHPKLQLDPDMKKHKEMIRNMDRVRVENWPLFKAYAINDATICVRYVEKIISQYEEVTGKKKFPVTLTSIGVDLLQKSWKEAGQNPLENVGREEIEDKFFSKSKGRFVTVKRQVSIEQVAWYIDFVTESYHGGRNEQFWFGPGFEAEWTDYDLSSAYPTAMSLIGMPKWREMYDDKNIHSFTPTTLGFAYVNFEFPKDVRFPTLPVRSSHGLIFPQKGTSYCSSPELCVAQKLGAKIEIVKGVIVPVDPSIKIFGNFIKDCLDRRSKAGSKTLQGLFWKEISNSTYGKTAQGLRPKRVYDMRDRDTRELPISAITNPFFASYITSFTRAVLAEVINSLPEEACVFSCTTDGFLSTATEQQINKAQAGDLCQLFRQSREALTGSPAVLEKKHVINRPLGWRTRGQATLRPGIDPEKGDDYNIILAKGGLFTPPECESVEDQNNEVLRMFFERKPDSVIQVESLIGVRDMVEHQADLVEKVISKKLSMEYDWKCRPKAVGFSEKHNHIFFSTTPWTTAEQFAEIRGAWEKYNKDEKACLKSTKDFEQFASFVESYSFMSKEKGKYLKKIHPDINRIRQLLCSAWKESKAGFVYRENEMTARTFAEILETIGIPCKRSDVENANRRSFVPYSCPPTIKVLELLNGMKQRFNNLQINEFLYVDRTDEAVTLRDQKKCLFVEKFLGQNCPVAT